MQLTEGGTSGEGGFTLIELMVVVLIIAILLAVAVPTLLGARTRAADRAAQGNARNAHVTQLIYYADSQRFTDDVDRLRAVDSSLEFTRQLADLTTGGNAVYVEMLEPSLHPLDTVVVGARSSSGSCFWIRTIGGGSLPRFADNDCAAIPALTQFRERW
jgi:type IV pilus assembly protein PilA